MDVVLSYEGGKGEKKTTTERREGGGGGGNRKTGAGLKKMERSGKRIVRCGFDLSCQSSVILENQSHMS